MSLLILLTLICTLNFMISSHPLSKGLNLLLYTIFMALMITMMTINAWYSYILFLIMVGGMLILFIYMTSIASNEKFKFTKNNMIILSLTMLSPLFFLIDQYYWNLIFNLNIMSKFNYHVIFEKTMYKYMNYPHNLVMFLMIIYLLVTLIAIVKITSVNKGPLRQKL
uniref:NADH-ubiquinone oxidoreductase chain 6 n=1 Tax=Agasicles hygrophila TaxID=715812 RepID=A0A0U2PFB5_9CUCU|nr:NADH dehydrogenase subunit 6 [Agasicles hygrophila]ALJ78621.1 NADH dehydrogenase subunit 6 [Agasicles hygrophila]ASO76777.1 NADH dehydrogenase subunit 6 [Agasicles hygrophila]